ncbi:uncharacterized protein BJ171DRAFT_494972 [Polychytrium aggregatum]|uniref:uncharacterized protein n=1 Tax=Polychytrium aggregatum TaxID=110093 RepID=UPI0022FF2377|nr:uncharacterized protein BJ171DRAFT_494972 [Polychytrium aggregatum]KAI9206850.1 hypothetical protein BJ171DRAFT_494972 [Polychytrium aggregatum]
MTLPKVFVSGASGTVGSEVAIGIRRAGYTVYGLVRSPEKAKSLVLNEIIPVIGDLKRPETYAEIISRCSIVVHCASDYADYGGVESVALDAFIQGLHNHKDSPHAARLIFTSGILVYKENRSVDEPLSEDAPREGDSDLAFFQARLKNEDFVLNLHKTHQIHGIVVRPGYVFGKAQRHFYHYFDQALEGDVFIRGRGSVAWSKIHIDDLVDGYLRILAAGDDLPGAAALSQVSGEAFNFSDGLVDTNFEIAKAFAALAGYDGPEPREDLSLTSPMADKSVIVSSEKAKRVLGWRVRHQGLLDEAHLYWDLWRTRRAQQ